MDINKEHRKMFEARHGKIWAKTDICEAWKRHHINCVGCKHGKQCKSFIYWKLSILDGHSPEKYLDNPTDYKPY